jgi:DNA-binding Lrp family transcriptional regulator
MKGHNGNAASLDAYASGKARHANGRDAILKLIEAAGSKGITAKKIAEDTGWAFNTFSGRVTELKGRGLVRGTGVLSDKAEILVAVRVPEQLSFLEMI